MEWSLSKNPATQDTEFRLTLHALEMVRVRLDPFDYALLRECDKSSDLADKLLAFEMLARRISDQRPKLTHAEPPEVVS